MVERLAEITTRFWWIERARIECAALLILGEHGIIPGADFCQMPQLWPGNVATTVPANGHDLHLEQLEAYTPCSQTS